MRAPTAFVLPQDLLSAENLGPHDLHERGNAVKIAAVVERIAQPRAPIEGTIANPPSVG